MTNRRGYGLLGMLVAALLIGILMSVVLKQYAGQTRRVLEWSGTAAPASQKNAAQTKSAPASSGATARQTAVESKTVAPCNGRRVGNICVPTEIRSSSLDAFEKYK